MSASAAERPQMPIGATPAWLAAVESAGGQCQDTGRRHHAHEGSRCPVRQGVNGGRLHLLADGAVMCGPCAARHEREQRRAAEPQSSGFEQGDLLALAS